MYVCGLAYEFCVFYTAKDAALAGFHVSFVEDASRAISEDGKASATAAMADLGITLLSSSLVPVHEDYVHAAVLADAGLDSAESSPR